MPLFLAFVEDPFFWRQCMNEQGQLGCLLAMAAARNVKIWRSVFFRLGLHFRLFPSFSPAWDFREKSSHFPSPLR